MKKEEKKKVTLWIILAFLAGIVLSSVFWNLRHKSLKEDAQDVGEKIRKQFE